MTARDFAYWLNGYFELAQPTSASAEVLDQIKKHLSLVFVHEIDPSHGGPKVQATLNAIHNGQPHLNTNPDWDPVKGQPLARC